jgi:hypothetical protein
MVELLDLVAGASVAPGLTVAAFVVAAQTAVIIAIVMSRLNIDMKNEQ